MIRCLLISDDLNFVKKVLNDLHFNDLVSVGICTDYDELQEKMIEKIPQIIIIEKKLDLFQIKNLIDLCYSYFNDNIIVVIKKYTWNNYNFKEKNVYLIEEKDFSERVIGYLKEEREEKCDTNLKILYELNKLGFDMKNKGDVFLLEAIKYIKFIGTREISLKNKVYPAIARKFNVSEEKIKWNIIYSINCAYKYNEEKMEKYFKYKPTSKCLIAKILEKI